MYLTAVKKTWTDIQIKASAFHMGQAWWRSIQRCNLFNEYMTQESEIGSWLKMFFALPALEPEYVEDSFTDIIMAESPKRETSR